MKYPVTAGVMLAALALVGCAPNQAQRQQDARVEAARASLRDAQRSNAVTCPTTEACLKAWQLAKVYAQKNSDMRFQFSDDTTASTYAPIDYEQVGIRLTKTPEAGASSRIELVAVCKGNDTDDAAWIINCSNRLAGIYKGFAPFVESKL